MLMSYPPIRIYDTMSGSKLTIEPNEPGKLGMYVCGVTVYDLAHIGHGRTFITFDIVVRYLRYRGYDVNFVRNHTDIDDKIIKRANERDEEALALAAHFIRELDEDMERLGCAPPSASPKVSEHLDDIVVMIEKLIAQGHAYVVDGDVFFELSTFEEYGKLSGRKLEDMRAGERVDVDERKKGPFDFALWKSAKPGEPSWDSPWGLGRPGWHIECSVMASEFLGPNFDIHGGGADLVFPHHENEIAQSECAHGTVYANSWMHVAMLNIDGEKMSKSLGNFWTIRDVLKQHHYEVLRYFMMTAHYRKPVNYSARNLDIARERIEYLYEARESIEQLWERVERPAVIDDEYLRGFMDRVHDAMDDDFNTPVLLAVINEVAREANELLSTKKIGKKPDVLAKLAASEEFFAQTSQFSGILGNPPADVLSSIGDQLIERLGLDAAEIDQLVADRVSAREANDWAEADRLRDELVSRNIILRDGADGTSWRIKLPADAEQ